MFKDIFSFKGRIRRTEYGLSYLYSKQIGFRIFNPFFFLFSSLKFTTVTKAMLENLCLDKRKDKFVKFSKNLLVLSIVYIVISNILDAVLRSDTSGYLVYIYFLILLPMLYILLAQGAKRCHDRGNSGWYQIIPFYVFWMIFADSDYGPNEYGNNPKGEGNYSDINEIGKQIENE